MASGTERVNRSSPGGSCGPCFQHGPQEPSGFNGSSNWWRERRDRKKKRRREGRAEERDTQHCEIHSSPSSSASEDPSCHSGDSEDVEAHDQEYHWPEELGGSISDMSVHEPEGVQQELQCLEDYKVYFDGDKEKAFSVWAREHADRLYPDVGRRSYVVPPLFVHKHSMRYDAKAGADILQEPQRSSPKGEKAHCHVTHSISLLSQKLDKPLFVVSGLEYDNMLKWVRSHPDLAPRLPDAVEKRGDIDLMAVHPDTGLIFIQVKAVGDNPESRTETEIQKKIILGGKQLRKDENIFRWVLHDWEEATSCHITRVVALPNLSRKELKSFWPPADLKPDSEEMQCMEGVIFLHKDDLPDHQPHVPDADIDVTSLVTWWKNNILGNDGHLNEPFMKDIVSRYVGLLSAVEVYAGNNLRKEVRSRSDAVDVCGMMFRRILLNDQQLKILTTPCQRRYLSGPPGSGKTVLLVLRARQHVRQGGRVVVVNMYRGAAGRAIGHFIQDAVGKFRIPHASESKKNKAKSKAKKKKTGEEQGETGNTSPRETVYDLSDKVHIVDVDIGPTAFSANAFLGSIRQQLPCDVKPEDIMFIVDEIYVKDYWEGVLKVLENDYKDSYVWCAGLYSRNPPGFEQEDLSLVLRCPPSVQKVLYAVDWEPNRRKCYQLETDPSGIYTPGLTPICVRHKDHAQVSVTECEECARELARILKQGLHFDPLAEPHSEALQTGQSSATHLVTCQDVIILVNIPRALYEPDEKKFLDTTLEDFKNYMRYLADCPLVNELRKQEIPVKVICELPCHSLYNQGQHHVQATWAYTYQGLENKVVVYLPGDTPWKQDTLPPEIPAPGLCSIPRPVPKTWKPVRMADISGEASQKGSQSPEAACGVSSPAASQSESETVVSASVSANASQTTDSNIQDDLREDAQHSAEKLNQHIKNCYCEFSPKPSPTFPGSDCPGSPLSRSRSDSQRSRSDSQRSRSDSQRSRSDSQRSRSGGDLEFSPYFWRQADVDRYSNWDKANLFVAGSRCLSQLVILIP